MSIVTYRLDCMSTKFGSYPCSGVTWLLSWISTVRIIFWNKAPSPPSYSDIAASYKLITTT